MAHFLPFLFLLLFQVKPANSLLSTIVFNMISFVADLVPLVFDYKAIVENIINPADNVDKQILTVLQNLQKVQRLSNDMIADLQTSDDFGQYSSKIADAESAISSVNEDFAKFEKASNEAERSYMSTKFIKNYEFNTIDTHLWTLKERAKGTPIFSYDTMPHLLSRKLKCNMTAVTLFQRSYLSLMVNGYALRVIYTNISGGNAESEANEWRVYMNQSISGLLIADKTCMNTYPGYATKDLEEIESAEKLHKTVQEKYPWFEAFIAFYHPVRGYQYHAIYDNYSMFQNVYLQMTGSKNKVMAFCEKKGNGSALAEVKVKILQDISTYEKARTGDNDNEAARHILNSILKTSSSAGIYPYSIIIFVDSPDFPVKERVTGYCANDVSFEITYDTVKEGQYGPTYKNVKYYVNILLPTKVMDQTTIGFTGTYKVDVSASCETSASCTLLLIFTVIFFFNSSNW